MAWTFDTSIGRYRDERGRFLSKARALQLVSESISGSSNAAASIADLYSEGRISSREFQSLMRQEIKQEYIRQYVFGKGGRYNMTQADWGRIGAMVKEQYQYLSRFTSELENLSPGEIKRRAVMYTESAREGYERGKLQVVEDLEMDEVRWNLDETAEHCDGCLDNAALGWIPMKEENNPDYLPYDGAVPGSGNTECLTNCKCSLQYRRTSDGFRFG